MRSLQSADSKEIKEIKAQPWQIELLKINPDYTAWGPYEDYMSGNEGSYDAAMKNTTWQSFKNLQLDDYNECVNFYFELTRKSENCSCGDGYHPDARHVVDSFYNHKAPNGIGWKDKITQDEYEALVEKGRIDYKNYRLPPEQRVLLTLEEVNAENAARGGMGHDFINQCILIETRLKRLGIEKDCQICNGKAYNYIEDFARVNLILWMIHPRKGASRGVEIKNIEQKNLPEVFAFLRQAAMRNAQRFSKIPE